MSGDRKPKAGTHVVFNGGRGLLDGRVTKDGIRVELDATARVTADAGLISDGPGHALALEATEGDDVGQYRTKADPPDAEPDPAIAGPPVGDQPATPA